MLLRYIEHSTCQLINGGEGPPPALGAVVETIDMVSGDRIVGTVVEVYNGDVRLDVTDGTVTGDDEDDGEDDA